jgi:hypothetical protein
VWKSFEEQRGTADDIAKVEGMMPVQGKRRYVDEETGQLVEGTHSHSSRPKLNSPAVWQITTTFLQMTSERPTRPLSSSFKWPMHGRPVRLAAVPGVAVAVAVHYQGSFVQVHFGA